MNSDELFYQLPYHLLSRGPREVTGERRDDSRLLVLWRKQRKLEHSRFNEIGRFLHPGDCIVLNDSRVLPSTVFGQTDSGGKLEMHVGPLRQDGAATCILFPKRDIVPGMRIMLDGGRVAATVVGRDPDCDGFIVEFRADAPFTEWLHRAGRPYLTVYLRQAWDLRYFQNVYAARDGSMEMPAAGRHFTVELIDRLERQGVRFAFITLHTGLSSQGVKGATIEDHRMPQEWCEVTEAAAETINAARAAGGRIVAVGTTVVRTLETASEGRRVRPFRGYTGLYIHPGYTFKMVDALVTNFHGHRSTRIFLAAAFGGVDLVKGAYASAIEHEYQFYEFGDATLTL